MIDLEHPSPEGSGDGGGTKPNLVEMWVTVALTLAMVLLPVLEVIFRAVRGEGVPGGSKYVQHLMVWLGFVGALIATGGHKHLGLSTSTFLKEGWRRTASQIYTGVVSAVTCLVLTWASYGVVKANSQGGDLLAGGIPVWWSELIVPISLGLITLRFIWHTPDSRKNGWRGRAASLGACVAVGALLWFSGDHAGHLFWPLMIAILIAFLLGAPVFVGMAGAAMLLFWNDGSPIASVPQETLRLAEKDALPAIPLFTMIGFVLAAGGASARIVRAYKSLFGWMPGGLALMVIGVCALFTTFTGGSGVTILALGGLLYPALIKDKYPEGFSLGLVTASGSLGLLFPPSLPVILYGVIAGVSTNALFLGGLVPGVLLLIVVGVYAVRMGVVSKAPKQKFEAREVGRALWAAKFDLGLPVVVVVVFVMGWATIVEGFPERDAFDRHNLHRLNRVRPSPSWRVSMNYFRTTTKYGNLSTASPRPYGLAATSSTRDSRGTRSLSLSPVLLSSHRDNQPWTMRRRSQASSTIGGIGRLPQIINCTDERISRCLWLRG